MYLACFSNLLSVRKRNHCYANVLTQPPTTAHQIFRHVFNGIQTINFGIHCWTNLHEAHISKRNIWNYPLCASETNTTWSAWNAFLRLNVLAQITWLKCSPSPLKATMWMYFLKRSWIFDPVHTHLKTRSKQRRNILRYDHIKKW